MMTPGRFRESVARTIAEQELWTAGEVVGVAVSGGVDSVVLLDALVHTRRLHKGVLRVVTLDHGQRPFSAEDTAWVGKLAEHYGLCCDSRRLTLGAGLSEVELRDGRFAWFNSLPCDVIALGHHLNDQAETTLLQMIRGAGFAGQRGMQWRRDRFVRPLLNQMRGQLTQYATDLSLAWREDPSNASSAFTRNRIRHEVMPILEAIRPGAVKALARSATHANEEAEALEWATRRLDTQLSNKMTVSVLLAQPKALLRRLFLYRHPTLTANQLDDLLRCLKRGHGKVKLGKSLIFWVRDGELTVRPVV
jgi:tRNA(Ile)-lysidine synthase